MSNFERDMANTMLDAADARIASLEADKADLLRVLGVADEKIRSGEDARGQYIRENAALEARCRELEAALHQAPIARVIVTDDAPAAVIIYAPGLPLGEHDLYCEPTASETHPESGTPRGEAGDRAGPLVSPHSAKETRADRECEPNEMDGPICMICGKSMETFVRQPIDCKHEKATIKCPDCGIDLTGNRRG